MIQNDQELRVTRERISYLLDLLARLRVSSRPEEVVLVSGGYSAEVERMQRGVLDYLTHSAAAKEGGAMPDESSRAEVAAVIERINRAWLDRRPADLGPLFHPALTMVLPGFSGRVEGREANVAGFTDFCTHATVHEYRERDQQIDVFGDTAVATFAY
jgi:hypothetical protein